jgi:hypothetical protein
MSIFNIFKRRTTPLEIGETSGDRIGCYLFGIDTPDGSNTSHHSLAISRPELLKDCQEFFGALATRKKELVDQGSPTASLHAQDLRIILNTINNLPMFIDRHLKQGGGRPFLELPGMCIFLRTGERPRQKVRGKYIE